MNKLFKIGLWMQGLQFGLAMIIGTAFFLVSVTWTKIILLGILFSLYNLISLILLLTGAFMFTTKPYEPTQLNVKGGSKQ
jgi:hypothetical protein